MIPKLHDYQRKGIQHLLDTQDACLFQCPGLGKTLQTLLAFELLRRQMPGLQMLVVAPLRVALDVWKQEVAKWEPTRDLNVRVLHGRTRTTADIDDADICIINYEGLKWLENAMKGREWPWNILVYDELTKTKSVGTARAQWIKRNSRMFDRHWGLTGTPMSTKGYEDLFGQIRAIDGGRALGTNKQKYIDLFFFRKSEYDRTNYIKPKGGEIITSRIAPIVYRLAAEDHIKMPDQVKVYHDVTLDDDHLETYKRLERDLYIQFLDSGQEVEAVSAGVLWGKLHQICQGFSYVQGEEGRGVKWHSEVKLDVLESIIEEAAGEPVLVFYKFKAELAALQERFPRGEALLRNSKPDVIERWNENGIPVLFANPISAGHGINLQLGGAHIIVWLALESSPEIYQQAVGRLYRQGQNSSSVVVHHINVTNPDSNLVDDDIKDMLSGRVRVQQLMLRRLSLLQQERASSLGASSQQASVL